MLVTYSLKCFRIQKLQIKFACKRTKTTSLVKSLGKFEEDRIVSEIQTNTFCLATDGSNDYNACKLYPVLVRYYSPSSGKVVRVLLGMRECTVASTGENILRNLTMNYNHTIYLGSRFLHSAQTMQMS